MDRIAAVVVTYNRKALLLQCLQKLVGQQQAACDILVVDNASTDGTEQAVQALGLPGVFYRNTGSNIGGAGGFNFGMRWAVEAGYQGVWLMDDDTLPKPDALEKLLQADALLEGHYGFLSSAVLWQDGSECRMNRPKLQAQAVYTELPLLRCGVVRAEQATFVSLFVRAETVRRYGLPIKEFFIWGDDIEYTRRLAVRNGQPSYLVGTSQVIHMMKENNGSSIATDDAARMDRYNYAFRNENYLYRQEGLKGLCHYFAKCGLNVLRILKSKSEKKGKRIWIVLKNMVGGFAFNPSIEKL